LNSVDVAEQKKNNKNNKKKRERPPKGRENDREKAQK